MYNSLYNCASHFVLITTYANLYGWLVGQQLLLFFFLYGVYEDIVSSTLILIKA